MDQSAKERMLCAQAQYEKVKLDNETLKKFGDSLPAMLSRMGELTRYYEAEWMEDVDGLEKHGVEIEVMGQDTIYDEISDQYTVVKEILLECTKYINRQ